ncbi:MAG: TolC family protein [Nitrospirota bacterium]
MMKYGIVALMVVALFSGTGSCAENKVTLAEAIKIALERNHEIKAHQHALSAQYQDIGIARSFLLPKVIFEERFLRTNNPTYSFMAKLNQERFTTDDFAIGSLNNPKPLSDFQTSLSFEQLLFAPKANVGLGMAKLEYAAQDNDYRRKREEIAFKVSRTFLMVTTAQEYVKAARQTVEDTKEHLRIAELRYDSGLGLYSDVLRASTAVTEAEQRLVSAQKNLDVAKRALGLLLGMTEAVEAAEETVMVPLMDLSYYNNASLSRNDVRALTARFENTKKSVKLAEAGYLPIVGIGGTYQLNDHRKPIGSEGDSWQLMAFLRWELFDGTKREHERAKAKSQVAETQEHLEGLRDAVSFQVYESYLGVNEAKKNAELSQSALKTAEEGRRLVQVRYESSLSPLIDLLDAQTSLDHARASAVARENEYTTAVLNLSYQSGTILKDLKIEE